MDEKALALAIKILYNSLDDLAVFIPCLEDCPYKGDCKWGGCVVDEAMEWAERTLRE